MGITKEGRTNQGIILLTASLAYSEINLNCFWGASRGLWPVG